MATLNEIVYDILEDVKSHVLSDDLDIDERQVIFKINTQRSLWLRNEYNKPGRIIDPFAIQSLGCVELEVADTSVCQDFPVGCSILRTKCDLPKTVELHTNTAITKVGPIDQLGYMFSFVSHEQAIFSGNGKFNTNTIFAFILNNRMYLKTNTLQSKALKRINIAGVFENPTALKTFCNTEGETCFSRDAQYPLATWLIPYIKERIVAEFIQSLQLPKDTVNDASSKETRDV